jgi:hypothetical protein
MLYVISAKQFVLFHHFTAKSLTHIGLLQYWGGTYQADN